MKAFTKTVSLPELLVATAALFLLGLPAQVCAQKTQGHIDLEDTATHRRSYNDIERDTIAYFEKFSSQLSAIGKSKVEALRDLDHDEVNYLTASYLYCALKKGVCPTILDGILEVDAYNSALNGASSCPNMSAFWRAWVAADMEKRIGYQLNIGLMQKVNTFKKEGRPKYIKCKNTISEMIADAGGPQGFIAKRYVPGTPAAQRGKLVAAYLTEIQKQIGNVFIATDTKQVRRKSGGGKRGSKKRR
jgi:hypothetical protein